MSVLKKLSAVYPGSFDPITNGHIDLVKRLSGFFDPLIVLISTFSEKSYLFSLSERLKLTKTCLKDIPHVRVCSYNGLTVNYMKQEGIQVIVRGIRTVSDFEYELTLSMANKQLFKNCETFIAFTGPEYAHLSSRVVKDIARHGGDLRQWTPPAVVRALKKKVYRG